MVRISVLGLCVLLCALAASAQTLTLPYRPVTSEYSNALDRIIFIAANPNQLHIYDPQTNTDSAVNLPKSPISLSVSLDGLHAAVGHDALISYVNLGGAYLEKTLLANIPVNSLVLGNDYVYLLTYSGGTQWVQISTGVSGSMGVYNGTSGRLHPGGTAIYTTDDGLSPEHLQDLNVSTGPVTYAAQGPYHGDYPVCGGVWFSPDGRRTYTGCATAYQAAPQDATGLGLICCGSGALDTHADDLYWGTLSGTSLIRSLTESAPLHRVAAIPYSYQYTTPQIKDNQVFLYDSNFLEPTGTFQLPDFVVNGNSYQAHGQQVFYNRDSTALYVVIQADGSAGMLHDFAVQVFPLSTPQACTPTFNAASTTLPVSGTLATVGITAPAACLYQASSNSTWIQLVSGAYGSGNGTLTYIARPNPGPQRTGNILLGGLSFAVTQPAAVIPENGLAPLGYSVLGAEYSKALDKVVLIASNPNELHIYDPNSGSDQIVPLPKRPFFVSVSPDGLSAAVGFDGWISIVNLSTATLTSTIQVFRDARSVLLADHGYVYVYAQNTWGSLFSVRIANGAINYVSAIYSGRYPRLYSDGNTFYTEGSKWDISQGPAALINGGSSSGCAPFWLTEDGARMITSCGKAYTTSPVPSLDVQYNGSFSSAPSIQWAAESVIWHSTAVIPSVGSGYPSNANADTSLQIYGDAYLTYAGDLPLPMFNVGSTGYPGHGRYVFWSSAEDKLIVLEQADSTAQLAADYGVTVYPLTTSPIGCSYSLGGNSATFDHYGGLNTVNVTTDAACTWSAVSNTSWISVNSGAIGFGSNTVGFTVAPNFGNTARSGTITIAGNTYSVTQGASPTARAQSILVTPSSGSAGRQLFSFVARDAQGAGDIQYTQFLISSGINAVNACYISYDPAGNVFYLLSDDTKQWFGLLGGSANTIGNGQCTIHGATSGSTKSATDLTTNVDISFRSGFAGLKTIYQLSVDHLGNGGGWASMGTWNGTGDPNVVEVTSLSPLPGSGLGQTLTATVKDGAGANTILFAQFVMNTTLSGINACFIHYDRASNVFFLLNDAATGWLGLVAGSATQVSNNQCVLHGVGSGGTSSGSTLTITYNLTFAPGFAGTKQIYMQAMDTAGNIELWHNEGTDNP